MPRRGKTKRIPVWDAAGRPCINLWSGPRTVPVRSGHEGKKAPESPTPKPIPTRCKPGRFAVRNIEHPTSSVQPPISKGGAKPPKATAKPTDSQPIGTPKPHQSHPHATLMRPSCDPRATLVRPSCDPHATLMRPSSHPQAWNCRSPDLDERTAEYFATRRPHY